MKKFIAFFLIVALVFVLAACRNNTTDEPNNGGGGNNDIGNTLGGGSGNGSCSGNVHRDDVWDLVCDDCGLNLENEVWFDHDGELHFPLEDI